MKPAKQHLIKNKKDDMSFGKSGIDMINKNILDVYPDQKNHPQATAMTKFWNGGPDPLDYISMLLNKGDLSKAVPEHWHYISFGLSDLHGDGRVHDTTGPEEQSGYGLELTFRLKRQPGETSPPMWPASLMNSLARYIFQTGNSLNCGDHIPWHKPLDNQSTSGLHHMLIAEDPQLQQCQTEFGKFQFRQIVGITESELQYVKQWKGSSLLDLLKSFPKSDGDKRELQSVLLKFDLEAAALLPLVMRSRLKKNKYFIFQNIAGQVIVFMPAEFESEMVMVDEEHPLNADGQALQIYCSKELVSAMSSDLSLLENTDYLQDKLPIKFEINSPQMTIMVLAPDDIPHR